ESCEEQPRNFLTHVASLVASRTADGLLDPKLVLAWLLGALGAPLFMVGMLVPIREAGALLPQLVIAAGIRALPVRKWVWAAGSIVQGLCAIGIAAAAFLLEGAAAGWAMLALLALLALARSASSISHKDVIGKTVSKSTRGTVAGTAGTVSAVLILAFGALLGSGLLQRSIGVIAVALCVAGALWILAALLFASLAEAPGATEGGSNALSVAIAQFRLLREDPQLVRFTAVRCLLLAIPLAPPFLVALEGRSSGAQGVELGPLVIGSALATISSSYVWGRLADRSSRQVLVVAGLLGAASVAVAAALGAGLGAAVGLAVASTFVLPALVFVLTIAEQGVRLGRGTHVVDMADPQRRGAYAALSNTISGVVMLGAGV
ncbi:MAG: MFS transporter, partial [Gammaproteobacteria bacterium]